MESYSALTRFWGKASREGGDGETGAIDIIAVRNVDGSLLCSPFHVRLPPPVIKNNSSNNVVKIKVNGKDVKVKMKIGLAGEAFFVQKTGDRIRRDSCTSPPTSPSPRTTISTPLTVQEVVTTGAVAGADSPVSATILRTRSLSANDIDDTLHNKHTSDSSYESRTTFESTPSPRTLSTIEATINSRNVSPNGALDEALRARSNSASGPTALPDGDPPAKTATTAWTWMWGDLPKQHKGARSSSALAELASLQTSPPTSSSSSRTSPRRESGAPSMRRFSLCGHVLREEQGAPEPPPKTTVDLRALLASYSIPDSSVESLLDDANLVVVVDDYLLNAPMLRDVLIYYNTDVEDVTKAINSLPIMTAEIVNNITASAKQTNQLPRWVGKQISNWSYERLLLSRPLEPCRDSDFFFGYSVAPANTTSFDTFSLSNSGSSAANSTHRATSPAILVAPGPLQLPNMDGLLEHYSVPVSVPGLELASSPLQQQSLMLGSGFSFYSSERDGGGDRGGTPGDADPLEDVPFDEICPDPALSDFHDSDNDSYASLSLGESGCEAESGKAYRYRKVLVPSQEQLLSLNLRDGANELLFDSGTGRSLAAQLFVWPHDAKIVVTDIEGVIQSKPPARGVWSSFLSPPPRTAVQPGVLQFLSGLERAGYKILYLSQSGSRASNKGCLTNLTAAEGGGGQAPAGPVFQSPERLVRAFGAARADQFKAAALRGVRGLFDPTHNPFYASFGHKECDMLAYSRCSVPEGRIYSVNEEGVIHGFKRTFKKTFADLNSELDGLFPPYADSQSRRERYGAVHATSIEETYNDNNFWKIPIQTIR